MGNSLLPTERVCAMATVLELMQPCCVDWGFDESRLSMSKPKLFAQIANSAVAAAAPSTTKTTQSLSIHARRSTIIKFTTRLLYSDNGLYILL